MFEQTADGFKLRGNVDITGNLSITGDMITSGTITGTTLRSVNQNEYAPFAVDIGYGRINFYDELPVGITPNQYFPNAPIGGLYYSNNETWDGNNSSRLLLYTNTDRALKIQSGGNMSIEALRGKYGRNTVYAMGDWQFAPSSDGYSKITFENGTNTEFAYGSNINFKGNINFSGANITW